MGFSSSLDESDEDELAFLVCLTGVLAATTGAVVLVILLAGLASSSDDVSESDELTFK